MSRSLTIAGLAVLIAAAILAGQINLGHAASSAATATQTSPTGTATETVQTEPGLIAAGKKVYRKCAACHPVGEGAGHRVGPTLNGIMGRAAASAEGFKYSPAIEAKAREGLVWTPETLDAFLTAPYKFLPQTSMSFAGLKRAGDRAAVVAYIAQFSN